MKVLYATDLHGQPGKFKAVTDIVDDHDIVILGADILPKGFGSTDKKIKQFINYKLPKFFESIKVPIIIDFGNDDWRMYYDSFRKVVDKYSHVHISHMNYIMIGRYTFAGMHYVPDYPFGIKDWCRQDEHRICDPKQLGRPYTSHSGNIMEIPDLYMYFARRETIRQELDKLVKPTSNVVYIIHAPPIQSGLDVCYNSGPVGSLAVHDWIKYKKPWLTLHGHIHESFDITGIAINKLYDTICINPGQKGGFGYSNFVWCEFNLNDVEGTFIRKEIKK